MKIVCISDTHNKHKKLSIPLGDMIIHAGDSTGLGQWHELRSFIEWYGSLPHKYKIMIAGNHDWGLEGDQAHFDRFALRRCVSGIHDVAEYKRKALDLMKQYGIIYLENESVEIEGYKIYGSPMSPEFHDWAFNRYRGADIKKEWDTIPDDIDILITHGPPHKILDKTEYGDHVGCEELRKRLFTLPNLKLHVFGHIHEEYGDENLVNILCVNASSLDEMYLPRNEEAIVVESFYGGFKRKV